MVDQPIVGPHLLTRAVSDRSWAGYVDHASRPATALIIEIAAPKLLRLRPSTDEDLDVRQLAIAH